MRLDQLAINSVSVSGDLETKIAAFQSAGFQNVEWALGDVHQYLQTHSLDDLKRLHDAHELRCIGGFEIGLQAFSTLVERVFNQQRLLENARILNALGATTMVVGTDGPNDEELDDEKRFKVLSGAFGEVASRLQPLNITLCLEFNWSPIVKSLRTAVEVARRSEMSNVGVLFDPAHYHCTPSKFEHINADSVAFIRHVHVEDMADKPGELTNCNSDRVLPGRGCLDLKALLGALEKHGYAGYFAIEMFSDALWQMPARQAAALMYESLLPLCE